MLRFFTKKICCIVMLCVFLNATAATVEKSWSTMIAKNPLPFVTAGIITTIILGKIAYNYYQNYRITHEKFIENCRSSYEKIYTDVQHYDHVYHNDVKLSDWELKEIIVGNKQDSYPFMTYYASLIKAIWLLKKDLVTVDDLLKKIHDHQKQFLHTHTTEHIIELEEMFHQLDIKGKYLREYATKTIRIITTLKKRIKLFREYIEDCYNWSQNQQSRKLVIETP